MTLPQPTTPDIKSSASLLAKYLPRLTSFLLDPTAAFTHSTVARVDIGLWRVCEETLVLAANLNYEEVEMTLSSLGVGGSRDVEVLDGGECVSGGRLVFEAVGSGRL
jgi:hypothetical protein